jgi:hypothetical protein
MASREENEAVAGLLRRSLARDAAASGGCPEPEFLAAYFEHSLDAAETAFYDRHFSGCTRCRAQLAAMVRADVPKPQSRSAWLLDWRLLTAAAAVMLLVTVWLVRKSERANLASQPANAPLVAAANEEPKNGSPASPAADRITAAPQAVPETAKKVEPALTAPAPRPLTRDQERKDEEKAARQFADSNSLEIQAAPNRVQSAAPSNGETIEQDRRLKQQDSPTGHSMAVGALSQRAQAGHAGAQQQRIPAASQMVMVEPSPAPTQSASSIPKSIPVTGRNVAPASPPAPASAPASGGAQGIGSATETVTVTSSETSNDKKDSQPLTSAYSASDQGAMLQVLAESSVVKVIDTPIPSIKWRITAAGFVERSEDGGATWKGQEPDPEAHLVAGSAPTDKVCWLVGSEGIVFVTKDATNWKKIPPPVSADLTAVSAKSASAATITTADGRRFSTHNEGKKWKPEN